MKTNSFRRAMVMANTFNLLVAAYLVVIAVYSLLRLRWYHQLTIMTKLRHMITSTSSYVSFLLLLLAALALIAIFVSSTIHMSPKIYISGDQDAINLATTPSASNRVQHDFQPTDLRPEQLENESQSQKLTDEGAKRAGRLSPLAPARRPASRLVVRDSARSPAGLGASNSGVCCSILLHLFASISLALILIVWLLNTGELVRDSIAGQLELPFARYQFANRSNHYSIAIDAMQDINNCCGSLEYTDFPHQRLSGLSSGHYPGSCCGKNIFGVNARVLCTPEEIVRARQTSGCVTVLASHYDLVSLLVVPVALVSLFVNITTIALMTVARGYHLTATR